MRGAERGLSGSDQGESRLQFSVGSNGGSVWRVRKGFTTGGTEAHREDTEKCQAKKCGAESGDPNLRFQPRLPGSVVGEASMGQVAEADKITGVTVLR